MFAARGAGVPSVVDTTWAGSPEPAKVQPTFPILEARVPSGTT